MVGWLDVVGWCNGRMVGGVGGAERVSPSVSVRYLVFFSPPAMPMVVAPVSFASWAATLPVAPAAPETRHVWPLRGGLVTEWMPT